MDTPGTVSPVTLRAYDGLPQYMRDDDAALTPPYQLLTYFAALLEPLHALDVLLDRINYVPPDEGGLADGTSDLVDPATGDPAWLPWQAQIYGVRLDQSAAVADQRAQIIEQRNGPARGTIPSIAATVAAVLSGTKNVTVAPLGDGEWTIQLRVLEAELPTGGTDAVTAALIAADVKPAAYEITYALAGASWDVQEADFPDWDTRAAAAWADVEAAT